jgi:hypothetical protein
MFATLLCAHVLADYSASAVPQAGPRFFRCNDNYLDGKAGFAAEINRRLKYIFSRQLPPRREEKNWYFGVNVPVGSRIIFLC